MDGLGLAEVKDDGKELWNEERVSRGLYDSFLCPKFCVTRPSLLNRRSSVLETWIIPLGPNTICYYPLPFEM
jgi:hypothetical protein